MRGAQILARKHPVRAGGGGFRRGERGGGAYHGRIGVLRPTHEKGVLVQSSLGAGPLFDPPYAVCFEQVIAMRKRML